MGNLHALVAATSNAPMDWVWGTIASVVFVGLIAIPAASLNARERKRRQAQGAGPTASRETGPSLEP